MMTETRRLFLDDCDAIVNYHMSDVLGDSLVIEIPIDVKFYNTLILD